MDSQTPLESLQDLQHDLVALLESRLVNVDRLSEELEASIAEFRRLLDRKRRNEQSRQTIGDPVQKQEGHGTTPSITVDGVQYSITESFRDSVYTVADELDLDEIEATRLCIAVQEQSDQVDETLAFRAVLRFHNQRQSLLDCLRLIMKRSVDVDDEDEDELVEYFREIVRRIVAGGPDVQNNGRSAYWRKCIDGFAEIEGLIKRTQDHVQAVIMTGQSLDGANGEALQAQRMFLTHQHEALAAIMSYLIRAHHVLPEDFRAFLSKAASTETPLDIIAHYSPVLICGATYFGSDSTTSEAVARDLHSLFATGPGQLQWKSKPLQAAATVWWLVEYSSRSSEAPLQAQKSDQAEQDRSGLFIESLKNKAFHFMLAVADFLKPEVWHDPAKAGLVRFLLDNNLHFPRDAVAPSPEFAQLTMQEFQAFTEAFVSHMPDALRQLKTEEDDKRRNILATPLDGERHYEMDLERFLLIVSYAYQDDPSAAADFWGDTESNLYGFLRWTSRRLPTPRVAAFCELLRSLATEEKSATHAHQFLLEDNTVPGGRSRKAYSVSWTQIFSELELYATAVQNRPAISQTADPVQRDTDPDIIEAETPIMLEAYLRLAAHVIRNSQDAQNWILREQSFRLHEILLQLAQSSTPPSVQACCFNVLAALLTDKTPDINDGLWVSIDNWISGGGPAGTGMHRPPPDRTQRPPSEKYYLHRIAASAEVATAFVNLLNALLAPPRGQMELALDSLPFPEALGVSHRHAGIDPYVDFVLGHVFTLPHTQANLQEDRMQTSVLRHACLTFAQLCLETFNEDLVVLANTTNLQVETTMRTKSLAAYARLHPFARTMEHLFNDSVVQALFDTANQNPDELETLDSHSPLVQSALKAVEVMNLAFELQPTYFDIVKPIVKTQAPHRGSPVANPTLSSFDEVILGRLQVVVFLANFSACRHTQLTLQSISLLQNISSSRKITGRDISNPSLRVGHRVVSKLQDVGDAIQIELRQDFEIHPRDIEGKGPPLKLVKTTAVLELLNASLRASPNLPAIAHCLLGFQCLERSVEVDSGSLFANGKSLFHSIAMTAVSLPPGFGSDHLSWLEAVRRGCTEVLTRLANATMTSSIVLSELRSQDFLPAMLVTCDTVSRSSLWDQQQSQNPEILFGSGSLAIRDFMHERENLLEFASQELKTVLDAGMGTVREKLVSALLGSNIQPDGIREPTTSAFALFDFFDLEISAPLEVTHKYFSELDVSACTVDDDESGASLDLETITQMLICKKRELWMNGVIKEQAEEIQVNDEIAATKASIQSHNRYREIQKARLDALEAWTDLAAAIVASGGLSETDKPIIALNVLQLVLPRFEKSLISNMDATVQLAKLTLTLVRAAGEVPTKSSSLASNAQEGLVQAFRVCLKAVIDGNTGLALRDICYRICCSILLNSTSTKGDTSSHVSAKQLLNLARDIGDRVVRVISEDAFSGRGVTRVSALVFLNTLLQLFMSAKLSSTILRSLTRLNFLPVLIDSSIGSISSTFRSGKTDLDITLAYFHTALALLLCISQIPEGVQLILTSNFFDAVQDSGLFSTDPDIGLDVDNPAALREFYRLLAAVLRVLVAVVARRGQSNGATMQTARRFLTDNRFSISSVLKLVSRQGTTKTRPESEAVEVATEFERLILVTGFLEEDDSASVRATRRNGFS